MKFSKVAVLLVCMSAAVMVSAETVKGSKNRKNEKRNLKKDKDDKDDKEDNKKSSKSSKAPSMAPTMAPTMEESVCSTCERKLPGYVLFGEAFDNDNFYKEISYSGFCDVWPSPERKLSSSAPPPPPPSDGICCYNEEAFEFCKVIAEISTAIYENDVTKCLLTSLEKEARKYSCAYSYGGKKGSTALGDFGMAAGVAGADDFALMAGLDMPAIVGQARRRRLNPLDKLEETLDELVEFLSTPEIIQAFAADIFFENCFENTIDFFKGDEKKTFGYCLIVFSFYKTLDATICDYQAACPIEESCTEELKFNTDYTKRRVTNSIPADFPVSADVLANIIAPCLPCEAEKSNGCSGFCNYVEDFSKSCDIPDELVFLPSSGSKKSMPNVKDIMVQVEN